MTHHLRKDVLNEAVFEEGKARLLDNLFESIDIQITNYAILTIKTYRS